MFVCINLGGFFFFFYLVLALLWDCSLCWDHWVGGWLANKAN